MPETYGPVVLTKRAKKLRKDTGNSNIVSPLELQSRDLRQMFFLTMTRPFRMLLHESIVSLTSLYLALAYAIFYLYFEAYPIIFQGIYGMSAGIAGLMFLAHWRGSSPCLFCLHLVRWLPCPRKGSRCEMGEHRRVPKTSSCLYRRPVICNLPILGRMDIFTEYPLGRSIPLRYSIWNGLPIDLYGHAKLPHRRL